MQEHICTDCGATVDHLEVFPGPRCLSCYTPIGEREFQAMTAEKLAHMWGAS